MFDSLKDENYVLLWWMEGVSFINTIAVTVLLLLPCHAVQCFFPAEVIKSLSTPTLIVNSAYDSWQVQ